MEDRKEQLQNTSNRSTEIFPINQIVTFFTKKPQCHVHIRNIDSEANY